MKMCAGLSKPSLMRKEDSRQSINKFDIVSEKTENKGISEI
jgi:hypothetical protein